VVMTPCLHSESLSPSAGLFALPLLMMGISSALVSKKSCLNLLLGGFLLIQSSALPDIFAVSEILNLVDPFAVRSFFGTRSVELVDAHFLGLDLAPAEAVPSLPLAFADSARFLFITRSIFSRSGSNSLGDFGRVEWVRLY
jgi:hypothetical protein